MNVSLNKQFKAVLRRCCVKYVASVVEGFLDANIDPSNNTSTDDRLGKEGFDYLIQDQEMVKKSFQVCGISSSDPDKVRNGVFFK